MRYRTIGLNPETSREVSVLSLGAMLFGTATDEPTSFALLDRYVDAFERYDMRSLTALLHEDATWTMPPYTLWLRTHEDIENVGPHRDDVHRARA